MQAPGWVNQRESRGEDAWEIQTSGRQLPMNIGMEDNTETKALAWGSKRPVISKAVREILIPSRENQEQVGVENRPEIQELGKRNQREVGGKTLPETKAHRRENQEQLRCKIDAETQTPARENPDRSRNKDAGETQSFEKNRKAARGEEEGETQAQGLREQGQTGSESGEETRVPGWGKQDQMRGDTSTEIQAEERRKKGRVGGENAVRIQTSGRENLGEVKKEDGIETQALRWGKQECVQSENVTDTRRAGWEQQDQGTSEKSGRIQVFRVEIQKKLRHEFQVGWENQGLKRGEEAGQTQICGRKNLREIREEDWVVIQAQWWGDQRPVTSEIDRKFTIPCREHQDQIGGEHRAKIQMLEKRGQRNDRDDDGTNTLTPEAENQRQLRGITRVETQAQRKKKQERFGDETSTDIQETGKRNWRGIKDEDDKETQELEDKNQCQFNSDINGKIHMLEWKNQECIRDKDGGRTQASEAEKQGELMSKVGVETHSVEWKTEEQVGGENGAEIQAPEKRLQREPGGEDGTETWAPGEESQSHLRSDTEEKTHLSDGNNQEQLGGENETETQAPEKRPQREPGGEHGVETQRPEREDQGQLDGETGESHSPGRSNGEQTRWNRAENPTLEKKSQREVGSKDGRKVQRLRGGKQRQLKSKVNGNTCSSEWKNQEQIGGENGAEIQIQGKRDGKRTTGDDGPEIQAPGGDYQGELRSEIDGEIQLQRQGSQNKGGDEDAAETQDVGSKRKYRAEDAGRLRVPRGRNKGQVRGKDAAKGNLQGDCSGGEGPPALTGSVYGAMDREQAVASAPCPEMKPLPKKGDLFLLASGEEEHVASQSMAPAGKNRVGVIPASQQARPKLQRSQRRDKGVAPGKTSGSTRQLGNLQSSDLPSACPRQAAKALAGIPTALTVLPKWPALKKSQRLLLESLMRRKVAHLRWGLPQRILESYLHFNFLGPSPLPLAGTWLPGLHPTCELQRQQDRLWEAQGCRPGLESAERSQRVGLPGRKSSKLPIQARALERRRPHGSEPMGTSIPPKKPKRVRPLGGPREPQDVQKEAPPGVTLAALGNPRPAAKSSSWCGQGRVSEPSRENSRGRKTVRPGLSQTAERGASRVRISPSAAGSHHCRKEHTSPEPPGLKGQQPTHRRRGSLEPEEGRGPARQLSACSTDTASFKRSLQTAAARLSTSLLKKIAWSPQLAKPQHLAPSLSMRDPDPTLLPEVGRVDAGENGSGAHTSLKRDLQPPGQCGTGILPKTDELGKTENPKKAPQNPPAPPKLGFMKRLRGYVLQHSFRK